MIPLGLSKFLHYAAPLLPQKPSFSNTPWEKEVIPSHKVKKRRNLKRSAFDIKKMKTM
jgi:hypothetical protein